MDKKEQELLRREWWRRLHCVNAMRDDGGRGSDLVKDTWFITTDTEDKIHLPDERNHVPRRVEMSSYSRGMTEPAADFFIKNPTAKWMLLQTTRGTRDWQPVILAWGE